MYKIIRLRVHGDVHDEFVVVHDLYGECKDRIKLDLVTDLQMQSAVDIDCILKGGWFKRAVTTIKLMRKLAKLRKEKINVKVMWRV